MRPWLSILGMYLLLVAGLWAVSGSGAILLPIAAAAGPAFAVFGGTLEGLQPGFGAQLLLGFVLAAALVGVGLRFRARFRGQLLAVVGMALWSVCGLLCLGPA